MMWRAAIGMCGMLGAVLATAGVAHAAPESRTFSESERAAAVAYWTPERMRAAVPADGTPAGSTPGAVASNGLMSFPNPGAIWTGGGVVARTVGRVYAMTYDGRAVYCTATAVVGYNRSTTMTAGGCAKSDNEHFMASWVFVPGSSQGSAPYGVWPARRLMVTGCWNGGSDPNCDVGAGIVAPLNGAFLTDVVGAQPIAFNQPRLQDMYGFTYTVDAPYYGNWLGYCSGPTTATGYGGHALACLTGSGAYGGPLFVRFDEATGSGTLNSVMVRRPSATSVAGAYFADPARLLYLQAQSS